MALVSAVMRTRQECEKTLKSAPEKGMLPSGEGGGGYSWDLDPLYQRDVTCGHLPWVRLVTSLALQIWKYEVACQ